VTGSCARPCGSLRGSYSMAHPWLASFSRMAREKLPARQMSIMRSENGRACSVAPVPTLRTSPVERSAASSAPGSLSAVAPGPRADDNRQADVQRLADEGGVGRFDDTGGDAAFLHGHASVLVTVMAEIASCHHHVARPHLGAKLWLQLGEAHRLQLRDIERVEVGHLRILDDAVVGADVVAELPDAPADLGHAG